MEKNDNKIETLQIQTGEQTRITPTIQEVASHILGDDETLIKNISDFIKSFNVIKGSREPNFRRTAEEIINGSEYDGCNEAGVAFVALLKAKGKPVIYIQALDRKSLENYSHHSPGLVGHVFLETEVNGQKKFINSTTGEITDQIPEKYIEAARGLDSWDIGLKEGHSDLQRLFDKVHRAKGEKIVSSEKW